MTCDGGPPGFDHLVAGTAAASWRDARSRLPAGAAVGAHDHLVVLAAHPDDESLGCGELIADAARAGAQVTVVAATAGEHSHPHSPTHPASVLAGIRRGELAAAVAALAPRARVVLLGLPDGGLCDAVEALSENLARHATSATVVAAPWREDGHPDHEACGRAAAELAARTGARLLEYPVWGWHWGDPDRNGPLTHRPGGRWVQRVPSPSARAAKAVALAEYSSQRRPLSDRVGDEAVLPDAIVAHFTETAEVFLEGLPQDLPAGYFDRLYRAAGDPWQLGAGFYEERKRRLLLAALPRERFRTGFEPGCGPGLLTVPLAKRCERLLAWDVAQPAVDAARVATAGLPGLRVERASVPQHWPEGRFDLVVVNEVGYYLAAPAELAERIRDSLTDDGVVVGCHWRHPAAGYPSSAEQVHAALGAGLHLLAHHVEKDFLLDVWSRSPASVAQSTGVVS